MAKEIPNHFFSVQYDAAKFPGNAVGLASGANCQQFCFEVLKYFGFKIAPLRSSELWEDRQWTAKVSEMTVFDLVLFNSSGEAYGAHVGICVGENQILHLSRKIGSPVVWSLERFLELPEYKMLIGIKRPIVRQEL